MLVLWLLAACGNDYSAVKGSTCDGVAQANEDRVDAPFDADGDGAFNAANPDCSGTYAAQFLDCDDTDASVNPLATEQSCDGVDNDCDPATPDGDDLDLDGFTACQDCADGDASVHPGASEVACNGVDDDCSASTPDGPDADGDGAPACADCDDADPLVSPDLAEACDNGRDDDCDGSVDEDCAVDYSDVWVLDQDVAYSCTFGLVSIDFSDVTVLDRHPSLTVTANGAGSQPGSMRGSFSSSTAFSVSRSIRGTCTEDYVLEGAFTSDTTFEATFTASFTGGTACFDCVDQSWTVVGTR